jgi:hypothetical protein
VELISLYINKNKKVKELECKKRKPGKVSIEGNEEEAV